MPRRKGDFESDDWRHAQRKLHADKRNPAVTCNYCGAAWFSNALKRLHAHLERCDRLPATLWPRFRPGADSADSRRSSSTDILTACGQSTDHAAFQKFIDHVQPSFELPGKRELTSTLLQQHHNQVTREHWIALASSRNITIAAYARPKKQHAEAVVDCFARWPDVTVYLNGIPPRMDRPRGALVGNGLVDVVEQLGPPKIAAVCTNDATSLAPMVKAVQTSYPRIAVLTCCARQSHELGAEILALDELSGILHDIQVVVGFFQQRRADAAARSTAMRHGLQHIPLVGLELSDWLGAVRAAEAVVHNQMVLQSTLLGDDLDPMAAVSANGADRRGLETVRTRVADARFWVKARELVTLAKPFAQLMMAFTCYPLDLSTVYSSYCRLLVRATSNILVSDSTIQKLVSKHLRNMFHPLMSVAYLADPGKFRERRDRPAFVTDSQMQSVARWLIVWYHGDKHKAAAAFRKLQCLRTYRAPFDASLKIAAVQGMTGAEWWRAHWLDDEPDIAELCIMALSIIPSATVDGDSGPASSLRGQLRDEAHDQLVYLNRSDQVRYIDPSTRHYSLLHT